MMVGEFDYTSILVDVENTRNNKTGGSLVPYPEVSYVFFYIFVLTMSVALMNLLIGLAVGDIDTIRKNAYMRTKAIQIQFVVDVENKYPRFLTRWLYKPLVVYQPNKFRSSKSVHPDHFRDADPEELDDRAMHSVDTERYFALKKELGKTKLQMEQVINSLDQVGDVLHNVAAKMDLNSRRSSQPISPRAMHVTFDIPSDPEA